MFFYKLFYVWMIVKEAVNSFFKSRDSHMRISVSGVDNRIKFSVRNAETACIVMAINENSAGMR